MTVIGRPVIGCPVIGCSGRRWIARAIAVVAGASRGVRRRALAVLASCVLGLAGADLAAPAQADPLLADQTYDAATPTLRSVLGYDVGDRITWSQDAAQYLKALAAAAPDRMKVVEYARTWQGRPLVYAVIGSARNMARLETIKANSRALADPRTTAPDRARALIADQPVIVWLAYSVHGNEPGPGDAALALAYHLIAARDDEETARILDNVVAVIVPTQNPDGRDRFIAGHLSALGLKPDPDRLSAERDEPWPSGRYNHYLFDLNRDWFAQTQPETRGHAAVMQAFRPQVVTDQHEMGSDQTFFFPPEADPINPNLTAVHAANKDVIGRAIGAAFDRAAIPYFTREIFDAFYPGYGDAWPAYQGALAMTFEQGSARGLIARQTNGGVFTFRDTVVSQFIASRATLAAAAANREKFLSDFYAIHASAIEEGKREAVRSFIIPAQFDQSAADDLARLMARHGVEVGRANAAFSACGQRYEPGAYVIRTDQPLKRLIRVLLDRDTPLDAAFMARQETRRQRGLDDEIYDVTGWSLPVMYNVAVTPCRDSVTSALARLDPSERPAGGIDKPDARAAFVVSGGTSAAARFMAGALAAGVTLRAADEPFVIDGRRYPAGSLVALVAENLQGLAEQLRALAAVSGAGIVGLDATWVTEGPSFGSPRAARLVAPRIAIAWDEPTDPSAAGHMRFVIERQLGYPATVIRTASLVGEDLSRYDVIILPDGDYAGTLGEGEDLKAWVKKGGVLVGISGALRFLADPKVNLLASRREEAAAQDAEADKGGDAARATAAPDDAEKATTPGSRIAGIDDYRARIAPRAGQPDSIAGALAFAETDQDHWLTAGLPARVPVLVAGSDIWRPLTRDEGVNAVRFAAAPDLVASGHFWPDNRAQLAYKPFVMVQTVDAGLVVAFTAEPTARGYLHGLTPLLANVLFRAPVKTDRVR